MKLLIVVGWKSQNWQTEKPEILYSGQCGLEAAKAAEAARQSGQFAKGAIKKKLITDWVPLPSVPTVASIPKPAAVAPKVQPTTTAQPKKATR